MDELFREQAFPLRPIAPGKDSEGFVFTGLDAGSKFARGACTIGDDSSKEHA
jgi:hypothetical protein